ncbi:MAG: hypothetical protein RQ826_18030 [Xanthomonadales bacterium]|nr:hypothetical protein [Xanthomonadales bacterium]
METAVKYDKQAFIKLLKRQGIRDAAVLDAMAAVPREKFVGLDPYGAQRTRFRAYFKRPYSG